MRKDYVIEGLGFVYFASIAGTLHFGQIAEPGEPVVRLIDFLFRFYLGA